MRIRNRPGPVAVALGLSALGGCSSAPTVLHPEHFYLQQPASKTFRYERTLPEDSWIRGLLTVSVEKVELAATPDGTYRMSGTASLTARGMMRGRQAAQAAPRKVVQAAMEPDNIDEVFEQLSTQPGVSVTRVHWDRLRTLQLPLDYTHDVPASPFSSALRGDALDNAAEVALVWHKVLAPFLSIPPFGTFSASDVDEREHSLELTLTQDMPAGAVHFRFRFERDRGLSGFTATLADGSTVRITHRE